MDEQREDAKVPEASEKQEHAGPSMRMPTMEEYLEMKNAEDLARIEEVFVYHAPINDQKERYQAIRDEAKALAQSLIAKCPYSRERSLALTSLQTAVMYANAAIAINEKEVVA